MNHHISSATHSYHSYLEGGGEMGERTRNFDWSSTVLGSPEIWSQSLLTAISIVLNSRFPMFIWWGPELIQFYNDAYRPSLGIEGKHPLALGQRGEDCWPEIWPVIKPLIDQVMSGGPSTWSEDQLIPIHRNNQLEDVYWTFSYSRINDETGRPGGVLVTCNETTDKVKAMKATQAAADQLDVVQQEVARQRDRLVRFFMEAPAGICILDGPDLVFELINPSYQQLFPGRELLGRPLLEAVPEIRGQPIWDILQGVYQQGTMFEGKGLLIPLIRHDGGPVEDRYFNFIYQPRHDPQGTVDGIMVFVFEVTDMVNVRNDLEKAKDTLQSSLHAAELGTFDINLLKGTMEWDSRCRELFGIDHMDPVSYEPDFVQGLHPEDRERITTIIAKALSRDDQGDYDVEYRTIGAGNQQVRWVKAKGKVYFNKEKKPLRFIGAVLDITEQKTNELRKNDFIAMVSHELKTPLTSLSAVVQFLHGQPLPSATPKVSSALDIARNQVQRMTAMINGFLNISQLESSQIQLNKKDIDLSALAELIVRESQLIHASHKFRYPYSKELIVYADEDKISSVISNLLSNAIKYSPDGEYVTITCARVNGRAQISVTDQGVGIHPADQKRLFERYYRVDAVKAQHIAGFGIGLYLSSEIIERHGGSIWLESEPGKGSTFYFSLPME